MFKEIGDQLNKEGSNDQHQHKKMFKFTSILGKHKQKEDFFSLDRKGKISLAKIHSSAQRPLNKKGEFSEEVKFCPCCSLPQETKGIIERFSICDNQKMFSICGVGTYLYFYFFIFAIISLFITLCMTSIPTLILSDYYTNQWLEFCTEWYSTGVSLDQDLPLCIPYVETINGDEENFFNAGSDWWVKYSSDNIKHLMLVYYEITHFNNVQDFNKVIVNYSLLNFLTLLVLLVTTILFIILLKSKSNEANLWLSSPSDYSLWITNAKNIWDTFMEEKEEYLQNKEEFVDRQRGMWSNQHRNEENEMEEFKVFLKEKYLNYEWDPAKDTHINTINLCFKLNEYMRVQEEYATITKQLLLIENDPKQIELNKDISDWNDKKYHSGFLCCKSEVSRMSLLEAQRKKQEEKTRIIKNTQQISKDNFSGVIFVTFNTMRQKELFFSDFPQGLILNIVKFITNLRFYTCCCCYDSRLWQQFKRRNKLKINLAPEPEDVIWENLEFTLKLRFIRGVYIYFISFILICISLGIIVGLNSFQTYGETHNWNYIINYGLSFIVSGVISLLNIIFQSILDYWTKLECKKTKTDFYLSFSLKLTIFTFVNSAIVPIISNFIQHGWNNNKSLVNNMLMIFLSNGIVTPLLWLFNTTYIIKKIQIYFIENNPNPDQHHSMTQRELNELYELPSMWISYKYSYIMKTLLMTFLFIPIFPWGVPISLFGFICGYIVELFNFTHIYKKPEMLDDTICQFYFENFTIILFCFGIGNWMFSVETFSEKIWAYLNLILFGLCTVVPFSIIFNWNYIGIKESELHSNTYEDVYLDFIDYERQNPMTKKQGTKRYLNKLKSWGRWSRGDYDTALNNIDSWNIMEMYYHSTVNYDIIRAQSRFNGLGSLWEENKQAVFVALKLGSIIQENEVSNEGGDNMVNAKDSTKNHIEGQFTSDQSDYNMMNLLGSTLGYGYSFSYYNGMSYGWNNIENAPNYLISNNTCQNTNQPNMSSVEMKTMSPYVEKNNESPTNENITWADINTNNNEGYTNNNALNNIHNNCNQNMINESNPQSYGFNGMGYTSNVMNNNMMGIGMVNTNTIITNPGFNPMGHSTNMMSGYQNSNNYHYQNYDEDENWDDDFNVNVRKPDSNSFSN